MRISRIYIKDFGVFREEKLEELDKGIVVIGGYNRAGKTSFMQLFRHLGFGFLKNAKYLPKPNVEYEVSYDVENNEGELFNVDIRGNASPKVKGLNTNREVSIEELYGDIDYYTYKQLFTISLDELQNTSFTDSEEVDNMQSILLGAGFKEIAYIPKFLKELQGEYKKIGGMRGNPSTAQFKTYNKEIKEGIEFRENAASQVDTYYEKVHELKSIENKIQQFNMEIKNIKENIDLLRIIKNNYENYTELNKLKIDLNMIDKDIELNKDVEVHSIERALSLKEEYERILGKYSRKSEEFIQAVGNKGTKDGLLINKEKLLSFCESISGIVEKINNYKDLKNRCINDNEEILKKMGYINENWGNDFNRILMIKTDIIEENKLNTLIREESELNHEKKTLASELKNIELSKKVLKETNKGNTNASLDKLLKRYIFIAIAIVLLGAALSIGNYNAGLILSLSGAFLGGILAYIKYSSASSNKSNGAAKAQLNNLKLQAESKEEALENIDKRLNEINKNINEYKNILGITEDVSGEMLKDYFRNVKEIKNSILNLQNNIKKANGEEIGIKERLMPMVNLIKEFNEVLMDNSCHIENEVVKNSNNIFHTITRLKEYMSIAEELQLIYHEKFSWEEKIKKLIGGKNYEGNIITFLNSYIENCRKLKNIADLKRNFQILKSTLQNAFSLISSKISLQDIEEHFHSFISIENVEEELNAVKNKLNVVEDELQSLLEKREDIKFQLQKLKDTESIEAAQEKIDNARKAVFPLGRKYATLKAAEFILEKVRNNFVEKTQDFLLTDASKYLSEITKGEYNNILPVDNLMAVDFKTVLKDGSIKESSEILSRATKEQLFFSVRLSRIKEINSKLPIILDDSFVNFDEMHIKNVLNLLVKVSKHNQVFITTCHSKLIEYLGEVSNNIKYLRLEKGRFYSTKGEDLIQYLRAN